MIRPNAASAALALIHLFPKKTPGIHRLCDQLNHTTSLLNLLLSIPAEVTSAHNDRDLGELALAQDLGVAQWEEVDDGCGVGLLAAQVGVTLLRGDKGPQLYPEYPISQTIFPNIDPNVPFSNRQYVAGCVRISLPSQVPRIGSCDQTYLVEVDRGFPELLLGLAEIPHADLTEVTRVVLVQVGAMVVLTTGHTTTTGILAVLADTTITGGHMAAAERDSC